MSLTPNLCRLFSVTLSTSLLLTNLLFGFPQASALEWHFRDQHSPLIAIWDASSISITSWEKDEVSIRAEVLTSVIKPNDLRVKRDNYRLDVLCSPPRLGRGVFLTMHVPARAILQISSDNNAVRITEPAERIRIDFTTKTFVQLNIPITAELGLRRRRKRLFADANRRVASNSSKAAIREWETALLT